MAKKTDVVYPILAAFERNKEGMLSCWCPYCAKWHHHGVGEGHRVAHCEKETPFSQTGYILKKENLPRK